MLDEFGVTSGNSGAMPIVRIADCTLCQAINGYTETDERTTSRAGIPGVRQHKRERSKTGLIFSTGPLVAGFRKDVQ